MDEMLIGCCTSCGRWQQVWEAIVTVRQEINIAMEETFIHCVKWEGKKILNFKTQPKHVKWLMTGHCLRDWNQIWRAGRIKHKTNKVESFPFFRPRVALFQTDVGGWLVGRSAMRMRSWTFTVRILIVCWCFSISPPPPHRLRRRRRRRRRVHLHFQEHKEPWIQLIPYIFGLVFVSGAIYRHKFTTRI